MALQFLGEYFRIYDSESRQQLLDAYHENAVMSMASAHPYTSESQYYQSRK